MCLPFARMAKSEKTNTPAAGAIAPEPLLSAVAARARAAGVFASVEVRAGRLTCAAKRSGAPAEYRIDASEGKVWVSLATPDRWLSQSIEADLVHTGDDLRDLIEEELAEQGYAGEGGAPFQHFRSEELLFTFRTALPIAAAEMGTQVAATVGAQFLLAYEACFRRLGDMEVGGE